jgi:hypothetical protein
MAEIESVSVSVREIVGDPKDARAPYEADTDFGGAEPNVAELRRTPNAEDRSNT